jgi:hypothetical protein
MPGGMAASPVAEASRASRCRREVVSVGLGSGASSLGVGGGSPVEGFMTSNTMEHLGHWNRLDFAPWKRTSEYWKRAEQEGQTTIISPPGKVQSTFSWRKN